MEGYGGGSEAGGKEEKKQPWTTSAMIENRGRWNLAADIQVLDYIKNFSHNLLSESQSTLKALDSLEAELNTTCVGVSTVANQFLTLADSQFVENRVYDDEETPGDEAAVGSSIVAEEKGHEEGEGEEEKVLKRLKQSLLNGLDVLNTKFEPVHVPRMDSEEEDEDEDSAPGGIVYRALNPFNSRPLPHIIGSKEFMSDPKVGLEEPASDDDDESPEESSSVESKALSGNERSDSEPETGRANIDAPQEVLHTEEKSDDVFDAVGMSFAEHLAARLEGMKTEIKTTGSSNDDLLPSSRVSRSEISVESPCDFDAPDRHYDVGFDDRYDDYNDSIFGRNSQLQDDVHDEDDEDLFIPSGKKSAASSLWEENDESSRKQRLKQDLESVLKKDTTAPAANSRNKTQSLSSSPSSHKVVNSSKPFLEDGRSERLFGGDSEEESDSLFAPAKTTAVPVKKKIPAGAVNVLGGTVDLFKSNPRFQAEKEKNDSSKDDRTNGGLPKSNPLGNDEVDEEDALFSSAIDNREKSSSKNSSVKLSDSFHDDSFSIKSNKSAGLFDDEGAPPPKASTKAMDDLFKDVKDDDDGDDDLFGGYFASSKRNDGKKTSVPDTLGSSNKVSSTRNITDDLFSDFKDDLFSKINTERKGRVTHDVSEEKVTYPSSIKSSAATLKSKNPTIFSDSDSDSEFIATNRNSSNVFNKLDSSQKSDSSNAKTKSLFDNREINEDDLFGHATVSQGIKSNDVDFGGGDIFKGKGVESKGGFEKEAEETKGKQSTDAEGSRRQNLSASNDFKSGSRKPLSLFDDRNSAEDDDDDGLFGIKPASKISTKVTDDLFSDFGKQSDERMTKSMVPSDCENPSSKFEPTDKSDPLFSSGFMGHNELPNKVLRHEDPLFSDFEDTNEIEKPKAEALKTSESVSAGHNSSADENILPSSNSDERLFTDNTDIKVPPNTSSQTNRSDEIRQDNISNNCDSLFTSDNVSLSVDKSLEKSGSGDSVISSKRLDDSLFGSGADMFSNIGKPGLKDEKSDNIFEKSTSSVPSLLTKDDFQDDDDDDLFGTVISKTLVSSKSVSITEKGFVSKSTRLSTDVLFSSNEILDNAKTSNVANLIPDKVPDKPVKNHPDPAVESSSAVKDSSPLFETVKLNKSESSVKPEVSVRPEILSKPDLSKKSAKPVTATKPSKREPPKSLNIRGPISLPDPFGAPQLENAFDNLDGGVISSEPKYSKSPKITPGKLSLDIGSLSIDPKALLPGAQPAKRKKPVDGSAVSELEEEGVVSPTGILRNVTKDRAKIGVKRRPQTRKARREALRQSTIEDDETDNSSSNTARSAQDQATVSSRDPSNVLSPSTDEEDLFGVPPLDLPADYTKVSTSPGDIFGAPTTVISPDLSGENSMMFDSGLKNENASSKPLLTAKNEVDDIFRESAAKAPPGDHLRNENVNDFFTDRLNDANKNVVNFAGVKSCKEEEVLFGEDCEGATEPSSSVRAVSSDLKNSIDYSNTTSSASGNGVSGSVTSRAGWVDDDDTGLFSSLPPPVKERKIAEEKIVSEVEVERDKPEAKNMMCGVLNAGVTLCDKISAPTIDDDDDEDLFSSNWSAPKRETKLVVSVQEKKSDSLFENSKSETIKTSPAHNNENDDDLFQANSSSSARSSGDRTTEKVAAEKSDIFSDANDDDLFGTSKNLSEPAFAAKSSVNNLSNKFAPNKSLFDDDEDNSGDLFALPKPAKKSLSKANDSLESSSKGLESSSKGTPTLSETNSSKQSKSKVLKSDPKEPFVDPLSSLDD